MAAASEASGRTLLYVTQELANAEQAYTIRKLGAFTVQQAQDELQISFDVHEQLSAEEYKQLDALDTKFPAPMSETSPLFQLTQMSHEFYKKVGELVGEVRGYRVEQRAKPGSIFLTKKGSTLETTEIRANAEGTDIRYSKHHAYMDFVQGKFINTVLQVTADDILTTQEVINRLQQALAQVDQIE